MTLTRRNLLAGAMAAKPSKKTNVVMIMTDDHGAWTLTDDRQVLVSREFSGSDAAIATLRPFHGQRLRDPLSGCDPVGVDFIRWHREPELGGIFRWPPLGP